MRYNKFAVPIAENVTLQDGSSKFGITYIELKFPKPATPKAVKSAIRKMLKDRYGRATPQREIDALYRLGKERIDAILNVSDDQIDDEKLNTKLNEITARLQQKAMERRNAEQESRNISELDDNIRAVPETDGDGA